MKRFPLRGRLKSRKKSRCCRFWRPLTAGLIITLFCAGCGKRITDLNLNQVKTDMSTKEVESILGPPTRVKSHEMTLQTQMKTLPATTYYYEQDGQVVELRFVADKLAPGGRVGSFGE